MEMPFSKRMQEVIGLAVHEARMLNHSTVDGHHVLAGIMRKGLGVAAQVLFEAHVNLDGLRAETKILVPPRPGPSLPLSATLLKSGQLQEAITQAQFWAKEFEEKEIWPIHVLLGILEVADVHVLRIIAKFRLKPSELADALIKAERREKEAALGLKLREAFVKKSPTTQAILYRLLGLSASGD